MEWIKGMKDEIYRLEKKVKKGEELTFSENYFLHTVLFLGDIFDTSR